MGEAEELAAKFGIPEQPVYKYSEIARILNCSPETIRKAVGAGKLAALSVSGDLTEKRHFRVCRQDLLDWLARSYLAAGAKK